MSKETTQGGAGQEPMCCPDEDTLLDYLQGWLPEEERAGVEDHIDRCTGCRAVVSAYVVSASDAGEAKGGAADGYRPGDALERGTVIEHFQVIRLLGQGAMGEVYLCRDIKLGRRVALKVVKPGALGSPGAVKRFLEEARTTARFNHPHIVTIHAAGVWRDLPYLALEYLEGQTLKERLARERPGVREALRIGLAIGRALAEAHRHQVLHRDLKPANVLLPRDGRLRVVDFGLAKILSAKPGDREDRHLVGTPTYMAPEQWLAAASPERVSATSAADIWALGVILFELVTGNRPFAASSSARLRELITAPDPAPTAVGTEPLPAALSELIAHCLAKTPQQRPSAERVCATLERLLRERPGPAPSPDEKSPFRGLLPFVERHAHLFFGRDVEIATFLERMREQGVLPVVGPSGAGKTSFVRAGVIPRLREQAGWLVLRLRPGHDPFRGLAARLLRCSDPVPGAPPLEAGEVLGLARELAASPTRLNLELRRLATARACRVLLFVDQLEELCTLVEDRELQAAFLQSLCNAGDEPGDPVRVIFTLRDDFLGRLAITPHVRAALSQVSIIRSPNPEVLQEIITSPLTAQGYDYGDKDLPRQMVDEVRGEPAALPLLQFTTRMLWERRDKSRRLLPRAEYDAIGGVAGALARHADSLLEGLPPADVLLARELLLRLVTPRGTRRAVARGELLRGLDPAAADLLDRLTQGRLLSIRRSLDPGEGGSSPEQPVLELAHESLLQTWGRMARWMDASREERTLLSEAAQAAELWDKHGRPEEEVWQGEALREALRTVGQVARPMPGKVRQFLELGRRREARRLTFRRVRLWGGLGLLLIIALAAVAVALSMSRQKQRAEQQRAEAQREGAYSALLRGDPLEARAKLRASLETGDSALTRLLWWRLSHEPLVWKRTLGGPVQSVNISSDGRLLATACADGSIYLFDTRTHALLRLLRGHTDQVLAVVFSGDGQRLASGSWDGEIRLWDVATGKGRALSAKHADAVWSVSFSPDGRLLASASYDKSVRLWEVGRGEQVRELTGHTSGVYGVSFSPDGKVLASASKDETVRLWEVGTGKQIRVLTGHKDGVYGVSFSPDGETLASGSSDQTVRLWEVSSGRELRVLRGHTSGVYGVSFSPDGEVLASGSYDKSVRLWDVASSKQVRVLTGHTAGAVSVSFSPDGQRLASGGRDRSVRLWDLTSRRAAHAPTGHTASVWTLSFSPDGKTLASGSKDETVRLWDVASGRQIRVLRGHNSGVLSVDFSPDGKLLASGGYGRKVWLWDAATGQQVRELSGHTREVYALHFSPDGKILASGGYDRTVRLWEVSSGRELRVLRGHGGTVYGVSFSPDGQRLASGSYDRTVRIWDVSSGDELQALKGHSGTVYGVSFSSDGRHLVSGSADRSVRVWDMQTNKGRVLARLLGRAYWLSFHPDSLRVGIPVSDGTARIWDLQTGERLTLQGHLKEVNALRFSPDGRLAATSSDDGTVRVWHAKSGRPMWRASEPGASSSARLGEALSGKVQGVIAEAHNRSWQVRGYADGNLEILARTGPRQGERLSLEDAPASPARRLALGAMDTLIAGYANGVVGIWNLRTGRRLHHARLHGPVILLQLKGDTLQAATELGGRLSWDLKHLSMRYCQVLHQVWQKVPVVWEAGRPVLRSPPGDHTCPVPVSVEAK